MKWRTTLIAGAALLAVTGAALGQNVVQNKFSGNECWNAGQGPGGPSTGFVCSFAMLNGKALRIVSGASVVVATTALYTDGVLFWTGTAPTTWTVTTPANPYDGETLTLSTDTTLTSLVTLTANTGQSLNSSYTSQTLTAATSVQFIYSLTTTKWYQIR